MEGLSPTTLARAREHFSTQFFPGAPGSDEFRKAINFVLEKFYTMGGWRGSKSTYLCTVASNHITLPNYLDSIISFRIDTDTTDDLAGCPGLIIGEMNYEFLYHGPGDLDATKTCQNTIIDIGEVPTLAAFPSTSAALTITISDAGDVDKAIRIMGLDDSSNEVHDTEGAPGERIVFVNPDATSSTTFSAIYGVQKDKTQGRVTIKHGSTTLDTLQPGDTHPIYRRFKVAHKNAATVKVFAKRRFVPVTDEEDYLIPGNLVALEYGVRALTFDRNTDFKNAEIYWQKAIDTLSGDQTEYRGGAQVMPQFNPYGIGIPKIESTM